MLVFLSQLVTEVSSSLSVAYHSVTLVIYSSVFSLSLQSKTCLFSKYFAP